MRQSISSLVRERARHRCEYCRFPEAESDFAHEIEHVRAKQHRGKSDLANLALACVRCNRRKGTNLNAIDPVTDSSVPVFNPREQTWSARFRFVGPRIEGRTPTGRATVDLLEMNAERRLDYQKKLMTDGLWPN